jgi:predicted transcriptional regulator
MADFVLQKRSAMAYVQPMIQPVPVAEPVVETETETERQRRLACEADGIARARTSIAAGYYATSSEVNAWIDSLGTDNPLPVPYTRHPRPR